MVFYYNFGNCFVVIPIPILLSSDAGFLTIPVYLSSRVIFMPSFTGMVKAVISEVSSEL